MQNARDLWCFDSLLLGGWLSKPALSPSCGCADFAHRLRLSRGHRFWRLSFAKCLAISCFVDSPDDFVFEVNDAETVSQNVGFWRVLFLHSRKKRVGSPSRSSVFATDIIHNCARSSLPSEQVNVS